MNNEDVLDSELISENNSTFSVIKWWEKKRFIFNLIVVGTEIIMMAYFREGTLQFGIEDAIIGSVFYTIAANIFFSLGWGVEIFLHYYFRNIKFSDTFRLLLFIIGVVFSIFYTMMTYGEALYRLNY